MQDCSAETFVKWCHAYVYRVLGVTDNHDDLVQEMLTAMWRAEEKFDATKGAKASWLVRAAEMRFKEVAYGHGRMLSSEPSTRQKRVSEVHAERLAPAVREDAEPRTEDVAEYVVMAYHRGEIRAALDRLTVRQREAATCILHDRTMSGPQRAAWSSARPQLAERLAHLKER